MKSRGRHKKLYPLKDIKNIVELFLESHPSGKVKYKEVYEFSKDLYINGKIEYSLSDDFWRKSGRQGRIVIDEINKINDALLQSTKDYFEVVSTTQVIGTLSKDIPSIQKKIIAQLKVNEYGYRSLIGKYKKQISKEESYIKEIELLKKNCEELKEKNSIYEQVLFQWADISSARDIKIINTITTGKSRSKVVEKLLTEMFTDDLNAAYKNINKTLESKDDNIIDLKAKVMNTLIEDLDL